MFLVEVHRPMAARSRSRGVLSLNTAAMSSSTISGSLLSVRMGTGLMFAYAWMAVNRRLKARGRSAIMRRLSKGRERSMGSTQALEKLDNK